MFLVGAVMVRLPLGIRFLEGKGRPAAWAGVSYRLVPIDHITGRIGALVEHPATPGPAFGDVAAAARPRTGHDGFTLDIRAFRIV